MANIKNEKKSYGSVFSCVNSKLDHFESSKNSFYPENNKLFYTGRHAIKYVIETIKLDKNINVFWIPEYYCQHVTYWLKCNYNNIKTYKVDPRDPEYIIDFDSFIKPNDVILINNFWGISNCKYTCETNKPIVIEDHSHGWLSTACKNSKADFCIASLRKSVPTPLGAIAWRPNKSKLPSIDQKNSDIFINIWNMLDLAMKKKCEFEKELKPNDLLKAEFLSLVNDAENKMHNNYDLIEIHRDHADLINQYLKFDFLQLKVKNYKTLLDTIYYNENFTILNTTKTPFGLTLHFKDIQSMKPFRNHLISKRIYPSLLWLNNLDNYGYFLNIHVDFRYTIDDMVHIGDVINQY
jgi:hypothetical protein